MKNPLVLSAAAAASGLFAVNASATDILARVISSTPVVQQVSVPRQICTIQPMVTQAPPSGGGGRALATVIGLVGGAMVGNNLEGNRSQVQNVQQCGTQMSYENRTTHYNVVYEYADKQYTVQMPSDPGLYVRLQVTPVGAMPAPQAGIQQGYAQPTQPVYSQPIYAQPVYAQPVYAQPVYVQPAVIAYPGYYPRPYYPPVGVSLNFGYSRGGYGHRHWR